MERRESTDDDRGRPNNSSSAGSRTAAAISKL
jgi:hypothetical protein